MQLLRDPLWNGFAAITALASLVVAIWVERERLKPLSQRIFIAVTNLVIGILVIATGFIIEPAIWYTLQYGIAGGRAVIAHLGSEPLGILMSGLFPGTVAAAIGASGKTRSQKIKRASLAAIVTLIIGDIISATGENPSGRLWFSLCCDVVGGILAGLVIGFLIDGASALFGTSE